MIEVDSIQEALSTNFPSCALAAYADFTVECEQDLRLTESISEVHGGSLNFCQNEEDVLSINSVEGPLKDSPGAFDVLLKAEKYEYYFVGLMDNNAGGRIYVVPAALAEGCPNLMASIELSKY